MEEMSIGTVVALAGFLAGIVFGATAQKTHFCTMGGVSDLVFMGDGGRMRAWVLAMAIAILGSQGLQLAGLIDLGESIYLTPNLGWAGAVLGGLMFGFGMTMAGGCGNKNLVRFGAGNLKSFVVLLVMGIFAYMTLRGLIGLARLELETSNINLADSGFATQGMPELLAGTLGMATESLQPIVAGAIAGLMLIYCFKDGDFRTSPANISAGLIIGALVPVGWWITGVLGADEFDPTPLFSFTFVAPTAESIQYMMTFTGASINFGIASVGGVILGAFLMSHATKTFQIEAFSDASDMVRHIIGAAIMGVGGVIALGCTVGQGITGLSTLALGSLIALVSIIAGAVWGLKYLEEGTLGGALKAIFSKDD